VEFRFELVREIIELTTVWFSHPINPPPHSTIAVRALLILSIPTIGRCCGGVVYGGSSGWKTLSWKTATGRRFCLLNSHDWEVLRGCFMVRVVGERLFFEGCDYVYQLQLVLPSWRVVVVETSLLDNFFSNFIFFLCLFLLWFSEKWAKAWVIQCSNQRNKFYMVWLRIYDGKNKNLRRNFLLRRICGITTKQL
jgi:hypothetical protein